ncbi:MAG: hypothetical protein AAF441_00030 [Pseudomonadota bacterium]
MPQSEQELEIYIFHLEDEPLRVNYPSNLEIALHERFDLEKPDFISSDDETEHSFTFRCCGKDCRIVYLIFDGEHRERPNDAKLKAALLHILDWKIDSNGDGGFHHFDHLISLGVEESSIWLITGYANSARAKLASYQKSKGEVRIVAKPAPVNELVDEMVGLIAERLGDDCLMRA